MRRVVVLPAPLEPMKPNKSPLFTVRSSPYNAAMLPNMRVKPNVCTAGKGGAFIILSFNRDRDAPERVAVRATGGELVHRFDRGIIAGPGQQDRFTAFG